MAFQLLLIRPRCTRSKSERVKWWSRLRGRTATVLMERTCASGIICCGLLWSGNVCGSIQAPTALSPCVTSRIVFNMLLFTKQTPKQNFYQCICPFVSSTLMYLFIFTYFLWTPPLSFGNAFCIPWMKAALESALLKMGRCCSGWGSPSYPRSRRGE